MTSPVTVEQEGFAGPEPVEASYSTGTYLDEFLPIYMAMAKATKRRAALSPAEVDALDITVVAALLGVGGLDGGDFDSASADLIQRRVAAAAAGEVFTWEDA